MINKIITGLLIFAFIISSLSFVVISKETMLQTQHINFVQSTTMNNEFYEIQWQKNYGTDWSGGRYQGPQPVGDCDNDGDNEWLLAGRDGKIEVMEWDQNKKTYECTAELHSPFYQIFLIRQFIAENYFDEYILPPNAGGFAIGDLTGDGENEIAATWYGAVYKYVAGSYRIIGFNSWIFKNGGGNGDCYIGDCDNDGQNELIMSGGGGSRENPIPEIVILKWNGFFLEKVAEYDDPAFGYAYMAGVGDTDNDGENEISVGITNYESGSNQYNRQLVLDWNKETNAFEDTILYESSGWNEAPFGGWCADSDQDGIDEIHMGYVSPRISIFDWDGERYRLSFDINWSGEGMLIEGMNIGDIDYDGIVEVCAGTDIIHILQYDGTTYIEESVISETFGDLAVLNIGDFDNDGKNEMNVAPVFVDHGQEYISWIFQHV